MFDLENEGKGHGLTCDWLMSHIDMQMQAENDVSKSSRFGTILCKKWNSDSSTLRMKVKDIYDCWSSNVLGPLSTSDCQKQNVSKLSRYGVIVILWLS